MKDVLQLLNMRVNRLNEEVEEEMPTLIIKNELELIQKALDELKAYYDKK